MVPPLLSFAYLPPVSYVAILVQQNGCVLEWHEHYAKQSYRNRCTIYGTNGAQDLVIPVAGKNNQPIHTLQISYAEDWQKQHWRSLVSAYKNTAFFDVLADDLEYFYTQKFDLLVDFNLEILKLIKIWLQCDWKFARTEKFETKPLDILDLREVIHPKKESIIDKQPVYYQPFVQKHGFLKDVSVVDLIFSQGPLAYDYLAALKLKGANSYDLF